MSRRNSETQWSVCKTMTVFVPKPLRYKCLRILSLFCVICARLLKSLRLFGGFACCHPQGFCGVAAARRQQRGTPLVKQKNASLMLLAVSVVETMEA